MRVAAFVQLLGLTLACGSAGAQNWLPKQDSARVHNQRLLQPPVFI